jgi:hypothetical protein
MKIDEKEIEVEVADVLTSLLNLKYDPFLIFRNEYLHLFKSNIP